MGKEVSKIGQSEHLRLRKNASILAAMNHKGRLEMIIAGGSEIRDKQSATVAQRNILQCKPSHIVNSHDKCRSCLSIFTIHIFPFL